MALIIPLVLSTAVTIANNFLMQKAVTFNTCHIASFLAEQYIRSAWSDRPAFFLRTSCKARKVDDDDDDDDDDNNNNTNNFLHVIIPSQCRCNIFLDLLLLNYLLTPWSRVLLGKLIGSQLVKNFPAFYGTRKFITAFTNARHFSLS
jgi:hypothetical protein